MKPRAGNFAVFIAAVLMVMAGTVPASAQGLSERTVRVIMEYAWSLTPQQFSKPDGSVIQIDKNKKGEILIPVEDAAEVVKAGRLSAHAQVCDLRDEQIQNHRALMRREIARNKWTPQQEVYISQLHLTTVMLMNGRIKLVEKEGNKDVIVDETSKPKQTCTDEQRNKVKELILAYVEASPKDAPTTVGSSTTGSTTKAGDKAAEKK